MTHIYRRIAGRWIDYDGNALPDATLSVAGNHLIGSDGAPILLRGVNISSTEGWPSYNLGFYEPQIANAIDDVARTGANAIRITLNQGAWLGYLPNNSYSGASYRSAITSLVTKARGYGLFVILDLHWNDPRPTGNSSLADYSTTAWQQVMADRNHSIDFWASVAGAFSNETGVIFDLYNEPHDVSWAEWRNGGSLQTTWASQQGGNVALNWTTAGMQELLDAVRSTNAQNVCIVNGLGWANDPSSWEANALNDPVNNLVLGWHAYPDQPYTRASDGDRTFSASAASLLVTLSQSYPVIVGETGDSSAGPTTFLQDFLPWCEAHGLSYLAWTFNAWANPDDVLISDWQSSSQPYEPVPTTGEGARYFPWISSRHGVSPASNIISRGLPSYASSTRDGLAAYANNGLYDATSWRSNGYPAWWAIDLSSVPAEQRLQLQLLWCEGGDADYDTDWASAPTYNKVGDYTIEGNAAVGGGNPPASGWVTLVTVTGNTKRGRQHRFVNAPDPNSTPYNWLRINATAGASTNDLTYNNDLNMKVEIANVMAGAWDTWLILGDSITADGIRPTLSAGLGYMGRFAQIRTDFTPLVEPGGAGGMKAEDLNGDSNSLFLSWLDNSPAHFVALNFGTNDVTASADSFETAMRYAIDTVLSYGKRPVVPTIPWGDKDATWLASCQELNGRIAQIYTDYGSLLIHGPDFYAFFQANPTLIQTNNVHPTDAGYAAWAGEYAQVMANNVYPAVGA